eukprot:14130655-Alexandrium_andersonii.AAC.1
MESGISSPLSSDHFPVVCTLALRLAAPAKQQNRARIKATTELEQERYAAKVKEALGPTAVGFGTEDWSKRI